ncbi:MAG: 2Fe-2S iron-sulfur cluster binding domain-containing protein [Clostridiales bacterium]|jgi:ferredoxin|nr:2Fe-2S iron-sulfur cluster binding domain-containing protein [Clostridiales bacterium]
MKYNITIKDTNEMFTCDENQFVLAAMISARKGHISSGCFGGGCGACRVKVLTGTYEVVKPMSRAHVGPQEQANGTVLMCCVHPRSDMTVTPLRTSEQIHGHAIVQYLIDVADIKKQFE